MEVFIDGDKLMISIDLLSIKGLNKALKAAKKQYQGKNLNTTPKNAHKGKFHDTSGNVQPRNFEPSPPLEKTTANGRADGRASGKKAGKFQQDEILEELLLKHLANFNDEE